MASTPRYRSRSLGPPPPATFSPFKELGTSGVAIFGGRPMVREKNALVTSPTKYITYSDIMTNISIVAAGIRYFLNIISSIQWTVTAPEDSGEAGEEVAEFVDDVINSMTTPWRRVMRRAALYRFLGFGIHEWTAARRSQDGKIGLDDVEARPQNTIERWEVDDRGTVVGAWQRSPQTSELIYLPRQKVLYMVEDSLSDSPEGMGLLRHLVDPYLRLQKYQTLEGQGFERDLRGIPVGRVPYQALAAAVKAGQTTEADANKIKAAIESFVHTQSVKEDTSIVLDSAPYVVETDSGKSISSVMQFGLELLQGQARDFTALGLAVDRLNREMARIIGVEHLLLGEASGSANRSLAEDKSRNFYLTVNGSLDELQDASTRDIVNRICDLNGIDEELRPTLSHSDASFRAVSEVTAALRDMATAGAVLAPDDPAINDVRDMLGIERMPEQLNLGMLGAGAPEPVVADEPIDEGDQVRTEPDETEDAP